MTTGNDAVTIIVLFIIQIMIIIVYLTEGPEDDIINDSEDRTDYRTARGKIKFEPTESILSAGETFDYSGKYRIVRFFRFGNHFSHSF